MMRSLAIFVCGVKRVVVVFPSKMGSEIVRYV